MSNGKEFADPSSYLALLPFVTELGISVVSAAPGEVIVEMPFVDRFSTPPKSFPASLVGTLGDVAAVASCISRLPKGWAAATLDYTVKTTGRAQGDRLRANGWVLQAGQTISVGASEIFVASGDREALCGVVLATTRNFEPKA